MIHLFRDFPWKTFTGSPLLSNENINGLVRILVFTYKQHTWLGGQLFSLYNSIVGNEIWADQWLRYIILSYMDHDILFIDHDILYIDHGMTVFSIIIVQYSLAQDFRLFAVKLLPFVAKLLMEKVQTSWFFR